MTFLLFVSLLAGISLAEIGIRVFGGTWLHNNLFKMRTFTQAFRDADGDDTRQALLLKSGQQTLQFSMMVLGWLVVMMAIAVIVPWSLDWTESQVRVYVFAMSLVAAAWWVMRPVFHKLFSNQGRRENAYGMLERWLHWLALEPAAVRHLAFELERQFALPNRSAMKSISNIDPADGAVYVCGLARSGTTMLLRILDNVDVFRSLSYRDMPFVLAPNLWKQITRYAHRPPIPAVRAHGDGVIVDFDSPEGFEEVFWRTFCEQSSDSRCLGFAQPTAEVMEAFADYRAIVANPRAESEFKQGVLKRYLSKNNNNLLRLRNLCEDSTATILLVYRNPVATARSLHRQHLSFIENQTQTPFIRSYMGWLAHHEFGHDHLPFCFALSEMVASHKPQDINYWLDYWNAVHLYLLTQVDLRLNLVNHDVLRIAPVQALKAIFLQLNISASIGDLANHIFPPSAANENSDDFCPELLSSAMRTYEALLISPNNIFSSDLS